MKKKKYGTIKNPIIRINPSLDKYDDINLAPEKLKISNERLAKIGLPKIENKKKS